MHVIRNRSGVWPQARAPPEGNFVPKVSAYSEGMVSWTMDFTGGYPRRLAHQEKKMAGTAHKRRRQQPRFRSWVYKLRDWLQRMILHCILLPLGAAIAVEIASEARDWLQWLILHCILLPLGVAI